MFDLHVTPKLPTPVQVNWPFDSGEEVKNRFSNGSHLGFRIRTILIFSDLQVTQMLPTKFSVNMSLGSGEEAKNRFPRWVPWRLSWIRTILAIFLSISHPHASYQVLSQLAFGSGEEAKIDYQDGCHGGHLGFLIGTILAIFDLQVTAMLPTKFQVNKPFSSEEYVKN